MRVTHRAPGALLVATLVALGGMSVVGEARAQDGPRLIGSVDQPAIPIGQSFTYTLTLEASGQAKIERLERPDFGSFGVLGSSKGTQFQSVNGRTTLSYTFSFQLRATREGAQTIGAARAVVNGEAIQSNPVTVKVTPRGAQPPEPDAAQAGQAVFAEVEVSEMEPYVGSQVQVTYKLYLDESRVGPFGAELNSVQEPEFDGFWIEELKHRRERGKTEVIGGRRYTMQVIKKLAVFPLTSGRTTIGSLDMEIEASQRRSFRRQRLAVRTKPVVLNVKPLPPGAPAGFDPSNVGQYQFRASIDKKQVAIGEPFTVRLEVSGTGMIGRVQLPAVKDLGSARVLEPVIDKASNASASVISGRKSAEIVVTPMEEGSVTIPHLELHTFDPVQETYVTRKTPNLVVRVSGRSAQLEREVELIEREEADQPEAFKIASRPLKALRPLPEAVEAPDTRASALWTPWFLLGLFGPPLALAVWLGGGWRRRRRDETSDARKRKEAPRIAEERLKQARAAATSGDSSGAVAELVGALNAYLSERLELPPGALSASRLRARLAEAGVDKTVIDDLIEVRRACDEARFSPLAEGDVVALVQRATTVFEALRRTI
ncbi:MAG: hypothetical protein CMH57_09580 [Myxococcales bacterium]|nr:hypothetical protein [Myxococcales bacterium]